MEIKPITEGTRTMENEILYVLKLTQKEARLLEGIVQNSLSECESPDMADLRKSIWDALKS